jgi:parallel beta-helix repeat protein
MRFATGATAPRRLRVPEPPLLSGPSRAGTSDQPGRRVRVAILALVLAFAGAMAGTLAGPSTAPVRAASCPASLQALIDATPSGGTLTVPACTFRESIAIRRPITILATGAVVDGENARSTGVVVYADDVTIEGLTVTRVKSGSHVGAINVQGGDRFTLRKSVARDSSTVCLGLHGAAGVRILDSELTGCGKEGYFLNGVTDTLFSRNHIHHNNMALAHDWFVEAGGGKTMASSRITFDGNEVAWNRGPGIWFDNLARDVVVTDNRVHHNDREGIFFEISSGARIEGNAVWNNGFGFAAWGYGAGITISSSDRATVTGNVVAWNARGISVISQNRELKPHDHNTVTDNVVVSAGHEKIAGWYDDHGGTLYASANANTGARNRYWSGAPEPTSGRFEWSGTRSTLAAYNATPGEEGAVYVTTAERDAILGAAGVPLNDGTPLPVPAPRAGDPRVGVASGRLGTSGVPVTVSWASIAIADAYQLQVQKNGGTWSTVRLPSSTSRSVTTTLATGADYRFRLRLRTPPATWSPWAYSSTLKATRHQETTSLARYAGTWRRVASSFASGGYTKYATAKGASVTVTFTGRAIAWVTPRGPSRGSARVYVDGVYRTTVSLYRSTAESRRIIFRTSWTANGTHKVEIRVVGTAGHPRIDVDAFLVLR